MDTVEDTTFASAKTGELIRWVVGLILASLVAYFTALGTLQSQLAVVTERETNHYLELLRRLDRIEIKIDGAR